MRVELSPLRPGRLLLELPMPELELRPEVEPVLLLP